MMSQSVWFKQINHRSNTKR